MKLGSKIKRICKGMGIPVTRLEQELGLARGSIGKWDEHSPSFEKVMAVCEYLNVDVSQIGK